MRASTVLSRLRSSIAPLLAAQLLSLPVAVRCGVGAVVGLGGGPDGDAGGGDGEESGGDADADGGDERAASSSAKTESSRKTEAKPPSSEARSSESESSEKSSVSSAVASLMASRTPPRCEEMDEAYVAPSPSSESESPSSPPPPLSLAAPIVVLRARARRRIGDPLDDPNDASMSDEADCVAGSSACADESGDDGVPVAPRRPATDARRSRMVSSAASMLDVVKEISFESGMATLRSANEAAMSSTSCARLLRVAGVTGPDDAAAADIFAREAGPDGRRRSVPVALSS